MKTFLARLLLAFMLVWLPLQGYASEVMTFCAHHHDDSAMQMAAVEHSGCHGHEAASSHDKTSDAACDNCFSCQLIAQPALIVAPLVLGMDGSGPFQAPSKLSYTLFFPEQPQRPPLALFS